MGTPTPEGHRERKKRETHRSLMRTARELVHEHGLEKVTVEDIADGAGVSVRTFFNYFSSKEEAVVGIDADLLAELADDLRVRLADQPPVASLQAILMPPEDPAEAVRSWQLRSQIVERNPSLMPRHLATTVLVEEALGAAVADALGLDPARDPRPRAIVAAVLAAVRSTFSWWDASDRSVPLEVAVDMACACIDGDIGDL